MPLQQLKDFLNTNNVKFVTINHSPAYTAQEIAQSAHIPGGELAKVVMIKSDGKLAMVVVPASHKVDLGTVSAASGTSKLVLANETEFKNEFPGCEVGAMPPFGNLFGMAVYCSDALQGNDKIAFNAGSHAELVQMAFSDFANLVEPTFVKI